MATVEGLAEQTKQILYLIRQNAEAISNLIKLGFEWVKTLDTSEMVAVAELAERSGAASGESASAGTMTDRTTWRSWTTTEEEFGHECKQRNEAGAPRRDIA